MPKGLSVTPETSTSDSIIYGVGFVACIGIGAGLVFTIAAVWINASGLSDLRSEFYRSENQNAGARVQFLEHRVQALEDAYNKDHPDAKVGVTNGAILFSYCQSQ